MEKGDTTMGDDLVTACNNGWIHSPKDSIDKVWKVIGEMLKTKETVSDIFDIFHAKAVKDFVEKSTGGLVMIDISIPMVCSGVRVQLDIDYKKMSNTEYYDMLKNVKEHTT